MLDLIPFSAIQSLGNELGNAGWEFNQSVKRVSELTQMTTNKIAEFHERFRVATLEEAQRCPKCQQLGDQTLVSAGPRVGSKAITYTCRNELCLWFNTGWVVQVNPDGTIPERKAGPKQFEKLTPGQETFARDSIRQVESEMEVQEVRKDN